MPETRDFLLATACVIGSSGSRRSRDSSLLAWCEDAAASRRCGALRRPQKVVLFPLMGKFPEEEAG